MTTWLTQAQAAELLGVSIASIAKLVAGGRLHSNGRRHGGSLDQVEVRKVAKERAREARASEQAAARRIEAREARLPRPPDDTHDWLTMTQAAQLLGVTRQAVRLRCARGKLPHEWSSDRRWVRRDLLEFTERARTARPEQGPRSP